MTVYYTRVSSEGQNDIRQKFNVEKTDKVYSDICSGSIPFQERKEAKKLIKYLSDSETKQKTVVHSIDRLGRNTKDVLNTVELFQEKGWELEIKNLGVTVGTPAGRMIITIMSAMAELELSTIRERQKEGVEVARALGKYKGRKKGTSENRKKILSKHKDVADLLLSGMNVTRTAKVLNRNRATVQRVKDVL